jgi:predicted glycosyltransferase
LADKTALLPGVEILDFLDPIDRLTAAADVVITKGTYGITCECSALGLPSIALSNGANPMDDFLSPRIRGTTWLNAMALSAQLLSAEIETCCNRTLVAPAFYNGAELSAKIILNSDVLNLSKRAP